MIQIHYVDALCGSGKTYQALHHAVQLVALGEKVALIQPSMKLINQSAADAKEFAAGKNLSIKVTAIHSGNSVYGEVSNTIMAHITNGYPDGEILFITHQSFLDLPYWHDRQSWHLIMDEIPSVQDDLSINIPNTHHLLTSHIKLTSSSDDYFEVSANAGTAITSIAVNRDKDDVLEKLKPLTSAINSDDWRVYFLKGNYLNLISNGPVNKSQLIAFALLQPSIFKDFKSATIMGANLKSNIIFPLWQAVGVEFQRHSKIQGKVDARLAVHGNGNRLLIHWCFPGRWSKTFRKKPVIYHGAKTLTADVIKDKVRQIVSDDKFLWVANKDIEDSEFDEFPDAKRIPNNPHGLNYYQAFRNVAFLSALNLSPAHIKFFDHVGITSEQLQDSMVNNVLYQSVLRGALRDLNGTGNCHVVVPDEAMARSLAAHFPGCHVHDASDGVALIAGKKPGRPRTDNAMTSAERVRLHRSRQEHRSAG